MNRYKSCGSSINNAFYSIFFFVCLQCMNRKIYDCFIVFLHLPVDSFQQHYILGFLFPIFFCHITTNCGIVGTCPFLRQLKCVLNFMRKHTKIYASLIFTIDQKKNKTKKIPQISYDSAKTIDMMHK